jgi:phage-related protein
VIKLTNALGAEKILPLTMSFKRVPLEIDVPSQPLYGLDGEVRTGKPTLRARQFALEGRIYYPDKEHIRQELDSILSFLTHPPIEVYRQHYHDRFLRAHALGAPQDWIDLGAELGLQIPMVAHDPYWYGQEVTVQVDGTQTIEIGGTAPAMPRIVAHGVADNLTIVNGSNGHNISVNASGDIEIDNGDYTCKVNGIDRLDLIGESWFLDGFDLLPGDNAITTNTPITLVYRPRWY